MVATISADIISSTSLTPKMLESVQTAIRDTFSVIKGAIVNKRSTAFWGRITKGDSIECYFANPQHAMRSALLLKCAILRASMNWDKNDTALSTEGYQLFDKYGVRIAIGIGEMRTVDKKRDIMDGQAIYLTGRKIAEQSTSGKSKAIIKNTLFFVSDKEKENQLFNTFLNFVDILFKKATKKQINIIYYKLLNYKDNEVAQQVQISHNAVNKQCIAFGWNAIASYLDLYETLMSNAKKD